MKLGQEVSAGMTHNIGPYKCLAKRFPSHWEPLTGNHCCMVVYGVRVFRYDAVVGSLNAFSHIEDDHANTLK